jgi:hypothetical protein
MPDYLDDRIVDVHAYLTREEYTRLVRVAVKEQRSTSAILVQALQGLLAITEEQPKCPERPSCTVQPMAVSAVKAYRS